MADASRRFQQPIVIIAPPRSGTTLLYDVLTQAPDLWTIGGESHVVIEAIAKLRAENRGFVSHRLTADDADSCTVRQLSDGFFARLRDREGRRPAPDAVNLRLLEKTPRNCLRIPFLAAAFPDAQFIYLYREPLETISSMLDAWRSGRFVTHAQLPGWNGPWSMLLVPGWRALAGKNLAEVAARQWAAATTHLLDDLEALDPGRWCVASYPRLLTYPQAEIFRLCRTLDVVWDRMLFPPLPMTNTILTVPAPDKWRRNAAELEPVLPMIADVIERAREKGSAQ
jgi:Sulfotransferase family